MGRCQTYHRGLAGNHEDAGGGKDDSCFLRGNQNNFSVPHTPLTMHIGPLLKVVLWQLISMAELVCEHGEYPG